MDVDEEMPHEPEVEVIGDESTMDYWELQPEAMIRHHVFPRKALFSPMSVEELPCDFRLLPSRITRMQFEDGSEREHADEWTSPDDPFRRGSMSGLGTTEIKLLPPEAEDENMPDAAPETPAPFTSAAPSTPGESGRQWRFEEEEAELDSCSEGFGIRWFQLISIIVGKDP